MATVWAKQSCGVGRRRGGVTHLEKGAAYDAGHPLVKERPDLFTDEPTRVAGRGGAPVVETATRAPGEKRRTPPRKTPGKASGSGSGSD